MLELRLTADAKRIASMRDAIRRECDRSKAGRDHAETVAFVIEQLVTGDDRESGARRGRRARRSSERFVIVTVHSDATMLMVREPRPVQVDLGERRRRLLHEATARWSTIAGREGRTICAEVPRTDRVPAVAPCAGRA